MTNVNIMRMSQLYAPTLKEDPADAEIASHRLLGERLKAKRTRLCSNSIAMQPSSKP